MFLSRPANLLAAIVLVTALSLAIDGMTGQSAAATPRLRSLPADQGCSLSRSNLILIQPVPVSVSELPRKLQAGVVFRTIASGGFAGQIYETLLFRDGRMIRSRVNLNGTQSEIATHRLSPRQVQQFERLVQTQMKAFDRLNYPALSGSADFITVTATSLTATVQYADSVESQLPLPLKTIFQAWHRLTSDF